MTGRAALQARPGGQSDEVGAAEIFVVEAHGPLREVGGVDRDDVHDPLQRAEEDGVEEPVLAAEVGVELRLVGACCGHDPLDARSGDPVLGELLDRHIQNALVGGGSARGQG